MTPESLGPNTTSCIFCMYIVDIILHKERIVLTTLMCKQYNVCIIKTMVIYNKFVRTLSP